MKKAMDDFMNKAVRKVKERLGDGYDAAWDIYHKNNGVALRGIRISNGISAVSPCIYMEGYYTEYRKNGNMEMIIEDIIRIYEENKGMDFSVDTIMDREQMLDRVLFRLVNTKKNEKILAGMPHRNMHDLGLSMVFYMSFQTEETHPMATVTVNNELMKRWNSSEKELLELAQRNTPKKMQVLMCSMQEMLYNMIGISTDRMQEVFREMPVYVLTNVQKLYGASCMLYDGVLEHAAKQFDSDFYILPSSIHEVMLLPLARVGKNNVKELGAMVYEINRSGEVPEEDVLSDEVYYFNREKRELGIAF